MNHPIQDPRDSAKLPSRGVESLDILLLGVVDERCIVFCTRQEGKLLSLLLLLAIGRLGVALALFGGIVTDSGEDLFFIVGVVSSKVARSKRNVGQVVEIDEVVLVLVDWQLVLVIILEV